MIKEADKEEILKVLDQNGKDTGKMEKRSVVHNKSLFHNEVALWIIDKQNKQVLLQRRSADKKQNPNKLALCAGHVVENETIKQALRKEAQEELGIDINNYEVKKLIVVKNIKPTNCCFSHHFYIINKFNLSDFNIQKEELSEVLYIDFNKLKKLTMQNDEEIVFKWNENYKKIFELLENIIL